MAAHNLVLIHHAILAAVDDFGPRSQQQLADSLGFDKSHFVARIDNLERRGLITRAPDPGDRRRNQVALTPAGKTLIDQLRPVAQASQDGFLQTLTPAEQGTLISLLRRVLDANDEDRLAATARPPSPSRSQVDAPRPAGTGSEAASRSITWR
ncbi:MAG: MarR family winged helix-turn-helix transcriptional regulator [Solirubrobacteraceae bacterium]